MYAVWCEACFDILNRLDVTNECDGRTDVWTDGQKDGRTDFLVAEATLNYVARLKTILKECQ